MHTFHWHALRVRTRQIPKGSAMSYRTFEFLVGCPVPLNLMGGARVLRLGTCVTCYQCVCDKILNNELPKTPPDLCLERNCTAD